MSTLSTFRVNICNSEDVRHAIVQAHNSGRASTDWSLINALTHDYQQWFHEIINAVETPPRREEAKWDEGEPQWVLISDDHDFIVAYASILLNKNHYLVFHPDKVLEVYMRDGEDMMEVIPLLRSAIDNIFWLHQFTRNARDKTNHKSLKIEDIAFS